MAAAFNTTVPNLEDELMQLILDGQIQARIDSHNKVKNIYTTPSFIYRITVNLIDKFFVFVVIRFCTLKISINEVLRLRKLYLWVNSTPRTRTC